MANTPRFPALKPEQMTDAQRAIFDEMSSGPRGGVNGPFRPLLYQPELLAHQDEGRVNSDPSWSADGKQLFAGCGFDDLIYRFDHADGLLSKKTVFEYPDRKEFLSAPNPRDGVPAKKHQRVPAGLAVTKDGLAVFTLDVNLKGITTEHLAEDLSIFEYQLQRLIR